MIRIEKPWGYEELLEENKFYILKRLFMRAGCRCSLQYHEEKHETIYVLSGILKIHHGSDSSQLEESVLQAHDFLAIPSILTHRMEGVDDCLYLEASTPQLDDVVRIEDDYGRTDLTAKE